MEKPTYNKEEFETLVTEILKNSGYNEDIKLWLLNDQSAKKWYDKIYTSSFKYIEENTIYGISYGDRFIEFDLKVGKIENLLKTFITQFSSKYKRMVCIDGIFEYQKKETIQKQIIEKNQDRVYKGLFYTTLYGIGFWAVFCMSKDIDDTFKLIKYLNGKNVPYTNELSDAGWVIRFKINKTIEFHNELLTNFKTI